MYDRSMKFKPLTIISLFFSIPWTPSMCQTAPLSLQPLRKKHCFMGGSTWLANELWLNYIYEWISQKAESEVVFGVVSQDFLDLTYYKTDRLNLCANPVVHLMYGKCHLEEVSKEYW